jgi:hypothetical protein
MGTFYEFVLLLTVFARFAKAATVLRIHDILVWIRIRMRGSMPLTKGSGSCYFVIDLQNANKKLIFLRKFFCLPYFLKVRLHHLR